MIARSSAKSSSYGSPFLHSSLIVSSTMVKRKGLRPDPCLVSLIICSNTKESFDASDRTINLYKYN